MAHLFKRSKVADIIGLSSRSIQFYMDQKIFTPVHKAGRGKGTRIKYSKREIVLLGVVKQMADFGMTVSKIRLVMEQIRAKPYHFWFENRYSFLILTLKEESVEASCDSVKVHREDGFIVSYHSNPLFIFSHTSSLVLGLEKLIYRIEVEACR